MLLSQTLLMFLIANVQSTLDPLQRYLGATDLQIGFGKDCHLFWRGGKDVIKNAEFRCGTSSGDPMRVIKVKENG